MSGFLAGIPEFYIFFLLWMETKNNKTLSVCSYHFLNKLLHFFNNFSDDIITAEKVVADESSLFLFCLINHVMQCIFCAE